MGLDIRLPIGFVFSVIGVLLTIYGVAGSKAIYERSLGVNVNLGWGVVLLTFGVIMALLGRRGMAQSRRNARSSPAAVNEVGSGASRHSGH